MSHYFKNDDTLQDDIKQFNYYIGDKKLQLTSNSGMFSPGHVDDGTDMLLTNITNITGTLLDLGCGYGVIGIALAVKFGVVPTFLDINQRALDFAGKNALANGITGNFILSNCFENVTNSFDTIVLNPPIHAGKDVIYEMYEQSLTYLNAGGRLFIVIQKKHGAKSSIKKLNEIFGNCEIIAEKKGTYILQCEANALS